MATATLVLLVLVHLLQLRGTEGSSEAWLKSEKHAELGTEIQLPCVLKLPQCIGLHSIKWYRGNDRIFIYSEEGSVSLGNDDIASRTSMVIAKNTTKSFLKVTNLTLEDEGLYKCEVTYLAVNRECNNVQHITLNITVAPASIRVIDETTEQTLEDGRVLGPIIEGQKIALKCESGKGRPVPNIEWYNGDKLLESESTSEMEDYGIGSGSGSLHLQVTRNELDATFTCKVSSIALTEPLTIDIKLDVHVRPLKMDIKGVVGHVIQGSKVLLQCSVSRARPPAKVTWYNGTELLILEENERLEMMDENFHNNSDSTTETDGYLAFTASEYDNGRKFSCSAENSVMLKEGIKPMKETTIIEVMYPPIVTMSPSNITVNETEDFELFCDYQANPATLRNVIWQRDGKNLTTNEEHYEGGITDRPGLVVKNSTPTDMGRYTCILENDFGSSNSQDFIDVSVLYKPITEVIMEPDAPVNEAAHLNVSLTCEVSSGNPTILTAVRWYLDGDLLKELPDCSRNTSMEEFCDIDPSKLLLETVGRSFHGNYSCEGRNDAGWGPVSPSTSVVVHYKPGPASISYEPRQVVKKGPLNITCSVKDLGRPEATGFKWYRGQHRLADENKAVYSIEKVRLEAEANFTCMAYNEAGDGDPATIFIDVSAPPAFIRKLNSYQGAVFNSQNVSIECWVECAPICNITWQKDNKTIDFSKTNKYYVQNTYHPPSLGANDFESIQSILVWNLTAWPFGQLDQVADNGMFTCESTSNGIGPGVKSSTNFRVEFPPVNITISSDVINVVVDNTPEPVTCNAEALPVPAFKWYREGKSDVISEGRFLIFKTTFPRRSNGTFYCEASNKYGFRNISTTINVLFKPECQIDRERANGKDYVVCSAVANPSRSSFYWGLKNENDTLEFKPEMRNGRSYLLLDDSIESSRTYTCIANNSIGFSTKCERHVPGNIPWWMRLEGDILIIVIVVAVAIVAGIIVICVILFLVCRRKHGKHGKYPSQAVNSNHLDSVSEGLADPETKTFYENLPFHGIQTPPNKLVSPKFARVSALHGTLHSATTSPCSSRPLSRATSLCGGSSGYESTRSHLGPHYSDHNMPRNNSPEPKYNSLKPRRRKHKQQTQFYSLRICQRHRHRHSHSHSYQLYAIPIYGGCPHKSGSTSTIATSVRSVESTPTSTLTRTTTRHATSETTITTTTIMASAIPPIPAPRTRKTNPSEHTYQNVPPPIFPQPASSTACQLKTHSIYDYKEHYQQQQEMQQYGYPIPSSSSSQLTLPLTRSLYHSSSVVSPLQTSYVHTNNRHSLTTQHHQDGSVALPYSLAHGDTDPDLTYDSQQQQPRRHSNSTGRTRSERRKYRKHQKQRSRRQSDHQLSTSCETSFEQVQDLGIPESYKISYPHYYEDAISECPADFPRESNRYSTTGTDPTKSRNKTSKSLSSRSSAIWTTLT